MGISNRIQAYTTMHPFSMNRKIDQYLSEHLPDLMDEYKIADRNDVVELDAEFDGNERRISDLEGWRKEFEIKVNDSSSRLERLKMKHGLNGGDDK